MYTTTYLPTYVSRPNMYVLFVSGWGRSEEKRSRKGQVRLGSKIVEVG